MHISVYLTLDKLMKMCGARRAFFERLQGYKYRNARVGRWEIILYLCVCTITVASQMKRGKGN